MKILLIDNHALFREGLGHILRQLSGDKVNTLGAGNFMDGLRLAGQNPDLDLALLELKTPGSDGVSAIKIFRQRYPYIPLVVVSSDEDSNVINEALSHGACGFVCKSSPGEVLLNTLSLVISGSTCVPPQVAHKNGTDEGKHDPSYNRRSNANEYGLTVRQMHVLRYLTAGFSNKAIAGTIQLSEGTVKTHVAAIYQTLRVKNRMDAMRVAKRLGLTGTAQAVFGPDGGSDRLVHDSASP